MSLPIPRQLWDSAAHLAYSKADRQSLTADAITAPPLGRISAGAIREMQSNTPRAGSWRGFAQYLPSINPSSSTIRRADRFEHTLVSLGISGMEAVRHTYRCYLVRELVDCPDDERKHFLEIIPDAQHLADAIDLFQTDLAKREE